MTSTGRVDWQPLLHLLGAGALVALVPLALWLLRHRTKAPAERLRALTAITVFLTFDLVLFGAFTRLTDSGLGCPDWPGCYGHASPVGAQADIALEQARRPQGPVTHGKAWVEMVHRYLATGVGALVAVSAAMAWVWHRRGAAASAPPGQAVSPWGPTLILAWICLQGAFGAWTVTLKLYPAVVTAHLLGGIGLLVLLVVQRERLAPAPLALPDVLRRGTAGVSALALLQMALGGWVSTNYAVLACGDFPTCQGQWWPSADFSSGFEILRELGRTGAGDYLPFDALVAIHLVHRLVAVGVAVAIVWLARGLWSCGPAARRQAAWLLALLALQVASGMGNVVLGWPLLAAVAHTGGAAALAGVLARLTARAWTRGTMTPSVMRPPAALAASTLQNSRP